MSALQGLTQFLIWFLVGTGTITWLERLLTWSWRAGG